MANPARGEVAFTVANTEYTLKFSTNAICELEDRLNKSISVIVEGMDRITVVRAMLWAGLQAKHPEMTLQDAGDIIDRGGMAHIAETISKALTLAFPAQDEAKTKKKA